MLALRNMAGLFLPGGVAMLATLVVFRPGVLPDAAARYLPAYPYVVLGAGACLAWYFNRSRVVFALAILALTERLLRGIEPGGGAGDHDRALLDVLSVLVPVNLAAYAMLMERGLLTIRGLTRLVPIAAQILAAGMLVVSWPVPLRRWLEYPVVSAALTDWTDVPPLGLVATLSAIGILAARRHPTPIEAGLVWAVVSAFLALHGLGRGWPATASLAAGGLALLVSLLQSAYRLAYHDELTGLPGRRALSEALLQLDDRYAVAMVDVDHFKRFNDTYGHHVGDQVLRMVATRLAAVSGGGRAFRYGGEEFCILFPARSVEDAAPHLEAVRKAIADTRFVVRAAGRPRKKPATAPTVLGPPKEVAVTVSMGVAERERHAKAEPGEIIKAADQALYRAKNAGRNRVAT